jgi:hypothetical protein
MLEMAKEKADPEFTEEQEGTSCGAKTVEAREVAIGLRGRSVRRRSGHSQQLRLA